MNNEVMKEKNGGLNRSEYSIPFPANTRALVKKSIVSDTGPISICINIL